jgi:hypothetical protein
MRPIANDDFDASGIIEQLHPDQEAYTMEEYRRFAILEAHWTCRSRKST